MTSIKKLRLNAGLKQLEACRLVHRSRETWGAYETGRTEPDPAVVELFTLKVGPLIEARGKLGLV